MQKHILKNGLTVLLSPLPHVRSIAIGVYAKTGSANETEKESGISHLVEHMLFKGTKTRSAKDIASAIEGRGGSLNAYTDKERTCYLIHTVDDEFSTALEILADMYQNSVFDPVELELEKGVVQEEIARELDDPSSYSHSLFVSKRWKTSPYGREVLGSKESVQALTAIDLHNHVKLKYTAPNTIISIAGNFDPKEALKEVEKYFENLSSDISVQNQPLTLVSTIESEILHWDTEQSYFCIGWDAPSSSDDARFASYVLNTAFGGEMYSRLFQEIREKRGLAYSVGSYTGHSKVGGLFIAYGGINPKHWDEVQNIVISEMKDISANGLHQEELEMAKNTMIGQIKLSRETPMSIMGQTANDEIKFGEKRSIDMHIAPIRNVTSNAVIDYVRASCQPNQASYTLVCPHKQKQGLFAKIFRK
jgi:predicted Zn-dependent peptidase